MQVIKLIDAGDWVVEAETGQVGQKRGGVKSFWPYHPG